MASSTSSCVFWSRVFFLSSSPLSAVDHFSPVRSTEQQRRTNKSIMLDAALQKLLSVIDSLVPSNSHSGSGRAGSGGENNSSSSGAGAGAGTAASSTAATSSSTMPKHSLLYEASPAVLASAGKPARGPEYRVLAAKEGRPKLEGVSTLYELWTTSVEKYGPRRCLGWRPKVRGSEKRSMTTSIARFAPSLARTSFFLERFSGPF